MVQTFEAIWSHGKIIPKESVEFEENTLFKITMLPNQVDAENDWLKLRGKCKGKLSTVAEFNRKY